MRKLFLIVLMLFVFSSFVFGLASTCIDSDGGNNIAKAGVVIAGGSIYADKCTPDGKLREFLCQTDPRASSPYTSVIVPCDAGHVCQSGACKANECSDGVDNDDDKLIDYPDDKGCITKEDTSEVDVQCSDTKDNDGDGLIDLADLGCTNYLDNQEQDTVGKDPGKACLVDSQCKYSNCFGGICGARGAACAFKVSVIEGTNIYSPLIYGSVTPQFIDEACESKKCNRVTWNCDGLSDGSACNADFRCESNNCDILTKTCNAASLPLPDRGQSCVDICKNPYVCGLDTICGGEGATCVVDENCAIENFCSINSDLGTCVPDAVYCESDIDCISPNVCILNQCGIKVVIPSSQECPNECGIGQICDKGVCRNVDGVGSPCSSEGTGCFHEGNPIPSSYCGPTNICGGENAYCEDDAQCLEGYACINNKCIFQEIGGCLSDNDCGFDELCFEGSCFVKSQDCDGTTLCPDNMDCSGEVDNMICVPKPGKVIEAGDNLLYDCDDLGGVYCPGASCQTPSVDIRSLTLESQSSSACCAVVGLTYTPGTCEFSEYNPLTGTIDTFTSGPCQDPDGDGEGTLQVMNVGGIPVRTEPCVLIPNAARENDSPFFDYWSLFMALGVIIGFYVLKRKF